MRSSRQFLVVLRITTDDPDEDLRLYPFEEALAPPDDMPPRHVKVVTAVEVDRS